MGIKNALVSSRKTSIISEHSCDFSEIYERERGLDVTLLIHADPTGYPNNNKNEHDKFYEQIMLGLKRYTRVVCRISHRGGLTLKNV